VSDEFTDEQLERYEVIESEKCRRVKNGKFVTSNHQSSDVTGNDKLQKLVVTEVSCTEATLSLCLTEDENASRTMKVSSGSESKTKQIGKK
jgi:hypothetical protein